MRLVIFDLDGTLVDSQNEIVEAQARAFAAHGLPAPNRATALSVVGLSLNEAFAALVGASGPVESLAAAYKEAWTELRLQPDYQDHLYPGAAATIATLKGRSHVRLGIATGKGRPGVDRIIAAQGWAGAFVTIQTADAHPSKPHPSMIHAALEETGADPASTLMIGDTTYDMEMAIAADVRPIGVAWGYHAPAALLASGAIGVAEDFADLHTMLEDFVREVA